MKLPPVAAFDFETTAPQGRDARNPEEAHAVQFALLNVDPAPRAASEHLDTTGKPTPTGGLHMDTATGYPTLINPGCPISAESAQVHGITDDHVKGAPAEAEAITGITALLAQQVISGRALVAANAYYDLTVADRRARAHHITPLVDVLAHHQVRAYVLDPMVIDRWADQYRRGKRTLAALADFYRVPLENAHDANADALAAALIVDRIMDVAHHLVGLLPDEHPEATTIKTIAAAVTTPERYRKIATYSVPELHAAQIVWRAKWAQGFQEWLRTKAPADRRDPNAVVDGSWPLIPYRP